MDIRCPFNGAVDPDWYFFMSFHVWAVDVLGEANLSCMKWHLMIIVIVNQSSYLFSDEFVYYSVCKKWVIFVLLILYYCIHIIFFWSGWLWKMVKFWSKCIKHVIFQSSFTDIAFGQMITFNFLVFSDRLLCISSDMLVYNQTDRWKVSLLTSLHKLKLCHTFQLATLSTAHDKVGSEISSVRSQECIWQTFLTLELLFVVFRNLKRLKQMLSITLPVEIRFQDTLNCDFTVKTKPEKNI